MERLFARKTKCGIPVLTSKLRPNIPRNVQDQIEGLREQSKQYYDRKTKNLPKLCVDDDVMVKINPNNVWQKGRVIFVYNKNL